MNTKPSPSYDISRAAERLVNSTPVLRYPAHQMLQAMSALYVEESQFRPGMSQSRTQLRIAEVLQDAMVAIAAIPHIEGD